MKNSYWIGIAAVALIVGLVIGYAMWGSTAAMLPEVEKELAAAQAQMDGLKKKVADMEGNMGRVTNEKLLLEKENADLKEAMQKVQKKKR